MNSGRGLLTTDSALRLGILAFICVHLRFAEDYGRLTSDYVFRFTFQPFRLAVRSERSPHASFMGEMYNTLYEYGIF